ncbi:MAG: hypothetical protein O3A25_00140 [Acidobacteria bacterium]|nr:hypothetical protein [Acidobacteriota bacterium]
MSRSIHLALEFLALASHFAAAQSIVLVSTSWLGGEEDRQH